MDGQVGRLKQTSKQTDIHRAGAMPQRAMTRASAFPVQHTHTHTHPDPTGRQAGGERGGFPKTSVDTQHPAHLKHTACNDWRHGGLPQGEKKTRGRGSTTPASPPTNSNGWGSINSSGGNNNPNKPRQRAGHLSELLIDHSLLETSYSTLPLWDMHASHTCHRYSFESGLFLAQVCAILQEVLFWALLLWL